MSTPLLGQCSLASCPIGINTFAKTILTERRLSGGISTPQTLLAFASSGVHPHSSVFAFPSRFCIVGQIAHFFGPTFLFNNSFLPRALLFFVSSRSVCNKLRGHDVTASIPSAPFPPSRPHKLSFLPLPLRFCRHSLSTDVRSSATVAWHPWSGHRTPIFLWRPNFPAVVGRPDPSRSTHSELVMFHPSAPSLLLRVI